MPKGRKIIAGTTLRVTVAVKPKPKPEPTPEPEPNTGDGNSEGGNTSGDKENE